MADAEGKAAKVVNVEGEDDLSKALELSRLPLKAAKSWHPNISDEEYERSLLESQEKTPEQRYTEKGKAKLTDESQNQTQFFIDYEMRDDVDILCDDFVEYEENQKLLAAQANMIVFPVKPKGVIIGRTKTEPDEPIKAKKIDEDGDEPIEIDYKKLYASGQYEDYWEDMYEDEDEDDDEDPEYDPANDPENFDPDPEVYDPILLPIKKRKADQDNVLWPPVPPMPSLMRTILRPPAKRIPPLPPQPPVSVLLQQRKHQPYVYSKIAEQHRTPNPKDVDPRTWRRNLTFDSICVTRTLSAYDVIPVDTKLHLSIYDAAALSDVVDLVDNPPPELNKLLLVFDSDDMQYEMLLTNYSRHGGKAHYWITSGWDSFARNNRLKAGDVINIYKTHDDRVSREPYFVIKYFRKPLPRPPRPPTTTCAPPPRRGKPGDDDEEGDYKLASEFNHELGRTIIKVVKA